MYAYSMTMCIFDICIYIVWFCIHSNIFFFMKTCRKKCLELKVASKEKEQWYQTKIIEQKPERYSGQMM